jgi:hypothetical protein
MRRTIILPYASDCAWFGRSYVVRVGDLVGLGYPCIYGIQAKNRPR